MEWVELQGGTSWGISARWSYDPQDWGRRWLPQNGASVYIDLDHLEITLPEVVSAYDHVAAFHAMLRLVEKARRRAQAKLPAGQRLLVTVNNSDGCSHSWGGHLNIMLSHRCFEELFERKPHQLGFLAAHLASAIVYTGQGKVGSENGAPAVDYQISQRADFIEKLVGIETTYRRPLINTRRESHAGPSLERLHLIPFDTTLCPTSVLLKVGATQLVLAMIEDGICETCALLDDPVTAIGEFSHDPSLEKKARTADGRHLTAVEVQEVIAGAARHYVDEGRAEGVVPRAREIVDLWEDTLEKLHQRDFAALARRLDWVLKLLLLDREIHRGGHDWRAPQIKLWDHLYASLDPQEGTFWALERQGLIERVVSEEEIAFFRRNPPEETRAWGRAHLLRRFGREITEIDWSRMETRDPEYRWRRRTLSMPDLLGFNLRQVEGILKVAASAWEAFELLGAGGEGPLVAGREAGELPEKAEARRKEGEMMPDWGLRPSICTFQSGTPSGGLDRDPKECGGIFDEREAAQQEE